MRQDIYIVRYDQSAIGVIPRVIIPRVKSLLLTKKTGPKDIVTHKIDGYKAKPFCSDDLAFGIEWILNNENYDALCQNAREKVLKEFDSVVVAKKYVELYEDILKFY